MLKVAVILASTRPGRVGALGIAWLLAVVRKRDDATFALILVAKRDLPFLDESMLPIVGHYASQHTKDWAATLGSFDAYVFVTPEYNHSRPGDLKSAIGYVHAEWNNKA